MAEKVEVKAEETPKEEFNMERFVQGSDEPIVTAEPEVKTEPVKVEPVKVETQESQLDDYWSTFTEMVGEGYKVPDVIKTGKKEDGTEITKKEKFQLIANEIARYTSHTGNPQVDSFVNNVIAASKEPGFNLSDFVNNTGKNYIQPANMSVDDKVKEYFKAEYGKKDDKDTTGLTDDEIAEEIKGLKRHEKVEFARKFDGIINDNLSKQEQVYQKQYNERLNTNYKKIADEDKKLLDIYITKAKTSNNIDGIELSEADHKTFMEDAPKFFEKKVKKDEMGYDYVTSDVQETLMDILASPEKSMTLMPFLWMYKNKKLGSYSSQLKEQVKKSIENKLGITPNITEMNNVSSDFNMDDFVKGKIK